MQIIHYMMSQTTKLVDEVCILYHRLRPLQEQVQVFHHCIELVMRLRSVSI